MLHKYTEITKISQIQTRLWKNSILWYTKKNIFWIGITGVTFVQVFFYYWQIWTLKPLYKLLKAFLANWLLQRHLAKGCTKQLMDVTGSSAVRNHARYHCAVGPAYIFVYIPWDIFVYAIQNPRSKDHKFASFVEDLTRWIMPVANSCRAEEKEAVPWTKKEVSWTKKRSHGLRRGLMD